MAETVGRACFRVTFVCPAFPLSCIPSSRADQALYPGQLTSWVNFQCNDSRNAFSHGFIRVSSGLDPQVYRRTPVTPAVGLPHCVTWFGDPSCANGSSWSSVEGEEVGQKKPERLANLLSAFRRNQESRRSGICRSCTCVVVSIHCCPQKQSSCIPRRQHVRTILIPLSSDAVWWTPLLLGTEAMYIARKVKQDSWKAPARDPSRRDALGSAQNTPREAY